MSDIEKEFLNFKRNFYGQFPSKICKNSKTLTGAGIPAGQKFSTGTGPDRAISGGKTPENGRKVEAVIRWWDCHGYDRFWLEPRESRYRI
jgi:hypothetical protein